MKSKRDFKIKAVATLTVLLFLTAMLVSANMKFGTDDSGQVWFGSDVGLITNSNGKAWDATGANLQTAVSNSDGQVVNIPPGYIDISSSLDLTNVVLKGSGSSGKQNTFTQINLTNNANITINRGGKLQDIKIFAPSGHSSTAVVVEGDDAFWGYTDVLRNVYIKKSTNANGIGLLLTGICTGTTPVFITLCTFNQINVEGFEIGMKLEAQDSATHSGFINGCMFDSICLSDADYLLVLDGKLGGLNNGACGGNTFTNLQIEPHGATIDGISMRNYSSHNTFSGVMCWDWHYPSGYAVNLSANAYSNTFVGYLANSILDNGYNNIFMSYGDVTGDLVGDVTGDLVGDVTGDLTGNVTSKWVSQEVYTSDDELDIYLKFSEKTGDVAHDIGIERKDGVLFGYDVIQTKWTNGKYGSALNFDGVNDYVKCSNVYMDGDRSVEFWFNSATAYNDEVINYFFAWHDGSDNRFLIWNAADNNRTYYTFVGNNIYKSSSQLIPYLADTWHHISVTINNVTGYIKFYFDGVLLASLGGVTGINRTLNSLYIGCDHGTTNLFNGTIDEFRVYNRVLSNDEIKTQYLRGSQSQGYVQSNNFTIFDKDWHEYFYFPTTNTSTITSDAGKSWFDPATDTLHIKGNGGWVSTTLT